MAKRIVLFHGKLDTLNLFTNQLCIGLEALGYEIYLFDLENSMQSLGKLYRAMQEKPITAMIGFNSTLFSLKTASGANVWEQLNIPCINILVDHPYWYRDILLNAPSNSILLCVDRNHMEFVNRFYPNIAINGFLAHGGTISANALKPLRERKIDVMYAGSLFADYVEASRSDFSKWAFPAEEICNDAIDYLMQHRDITIEATLETILEEHGVKLDEQELAEFLSDCVYIERVVGSCFREKILSKIAGAGISLTLFGDGWERCEWISLPNVSYGGRIPPGEILSQMEDSKIVLNTFPWFKDGSHERIYNGMLRGCLIASDTSVYLEETLPGDLWCQFSLSDEDIEALPDRLRSVLAHIDEAQITADAGYQYALSGHTWQQRAREIHEDILSYL